MSNWRKLDSRTLGLTQSMVSLPSLIVLKILQGAGDVLCPFFCVGHFHNFAHIFSTHAVVDACTLRMFIRLAILYIVI